MKKLFFVVQSEIMTGGVIEAQVIASLRAQCAAPGQPPTQLVFLEAASEVRKPAVRAKFREFQSLWPAGRMSLVPFVGRFGGNDAPGRALALWLWRERLSGDDLIFHCRGPEATLDAAVARRWLGRGRIVFDVRGAAPYEVIHRHGHCFRENLPPEAERDYQKNLALDTRAARAADELLVVSPGLRDYAVELLGADAARVSVVPSSVGETNYSDEDRAAARARWQVAGDAPVLLYSGRLGPERLPEHLFRLFRAMLDARPDAKLVVLSYLNQLQDLPALREAARVPAKRVVVDELPRDEVVKVLPGADVAAIFLEPALRFELAVPIKLAEYLGAGVPLVINETFAWISDLMRQHRAGWVVNHDLPDAEMQAAARNLCEEIARDRAGWRDRALELCERHFVWPRHLPTIRRAYGAAEN
jgi:glycosyltransferase involved in cell wall biosynthesis